MSSLLTNCFIKWNHDYSFDDLNKTKHIIFSNSQHSNIICNDGMEKSL